MIKINKIRKSYGRNFLLEIDNLQINEGSITALMGPNGSGKTTLMKNVLGLVIPDSGNIEVCGINIAREFSYRNNICYMPQTALYPPNLKVKEVISIVKELRRKQENYDYELYESYDIEKILEKKIGTLSQGTRQRLGAALVFMFKSRIVILDEPTAGLDPLSAEKLKAKILREKNSDKLILFTTHIISEAKELADRLIMLHEGKIKVDRSLDHEKLKKNGTDFVKNITELFGQNEHMENS